MKEQVTCRICGQLGNPSPGKTLCRECLNQRSRELYKRDSSPYAKRSRKWREENKEANATYQKQYRRKNPWHYAMGRAKRDDLAFELTLSECESIWSATACDFCGVDFFSGGKGTVQTADRVDPSQGYIPGNVVCLCFSCNRRKSDQTPTQLRAMADWIESKLKGKS